MSQEEHKLEFTERDIHRLAQTVGRPMPKQQKDRILEQARGKDKEQKKAALERGVKNKDKSKDRSMDK